MNGESSEFQVAPESVLSTENELKTAESTSEFNTHYYNNFQYNQPLTGVLSSNENNTQAPVYSDYYYTSQADPQRQPNELTYERSTESGVAFGQETVQDVLSHGNAQTAFPGTSTYHTDYPVYNQQYQQGQAETLAQQHFSRQSVIEYFSNGDTTLAPVLGPTSTSVTTASSFAPESPPAIIINSGKSPIVALCEGPDNSNLTFGNYEFCGSSPANITRPLDNPEARAMNFTDNRLAEARYNPNMQQPNMQTETINTVLAHQWHERREKLPTTPDTAFYAEWQINRPAVVNTAEIQNARKLLFLQRRAAEKQLGQVNQQKESSPPKQTEQQQQQHEQPQQQEQQVHQAHHLYRLHQMQQQNHLRSLTPDSPSSSRQFALSPLSAISSGSGQQTFPHVHPGSFPQTQMQEALLPNGGNSMNNLLANPFQQLLIMQALQQQQQQQQQYLQQSLIQPYQPIVSSDFFDNWQKYNQQRYGDALKENTTRHKGTNNPRQVPRKRKRQHSAAEVIDDKENASVDSSEPALVIDELTIQPSNVQLESSKCDDDLEPKLASYEGQVEESVVENLGVTKKSTSKRGKSVKRNKPSKGKSPTTDPTGMWLNDHAMFQDWLNTQQQSVDQNESGMVQCENASME